MCTNKPKFAMPYASLPDSVSELLIQLNAKPRLVAHLTLVHDVAIQLVDKIEKNFKGLSFDKDAVLMGAATHDIGKAKLPGELTGGGSDHEIIGEQILKDAGFPDKIARFARTHGGPKREQNPTLEDLLVQEADAIWKGGRYKNLEERLIKMICEKTGEPEWKVFSSLDDILTDLAKDAHLRLEWQAMHEA